MILAKHEAEYIKRKANYSESEVVILKKFCHTYRYKVCLIKENGKLKVGIKSGPTTMSISWDGERYIKDGPMSRFIGKSHFEWPISNSD